MIEKSRKTLKTKRVVLFILALAVVAVIIIAAVGFVRKQSMRVELDTQGLNYVVCYSRGLGPRRLEYVEHRELIDDLLDKVSGEYKYTGTYSNAGYSGGGPNALKLYGEKNKLLGEFLYRDGKIYKSQGNSKYYIYKNKEGLIDFEDFEEILNLYGEY